MGAGMGYRGGVTEVDRPDPGSGCLDVLVTQGDPRKGIPFHRLQRHHREHGGIAIAAEKPPSPIVQRTPELSSSGQGGHGLFPGIVTEIQAGKSQLVVRLIHGVDLLAVEPVVEIDRIVQPPAWTGDLELVVARLVTDVERSDLVGTIVAIGVSEKEDGGAGSRENSIPQRQQSLNVVEFIRPGDRFIHATIAVMVFQQTNPREQRCPLRRKRVVPHLGHKHSALRIPGHIHRITGQRLGRDQLEFVVSVDLPGLPRLLRTQGKSAGQDTAFPAGGVSGVGGGFRRLPFLLELPQRPELPPPHPEFGELALQGDKPLGRIHLGGLVYRRTVEGNGQFVSPADDLEPVPFAGRIFDVFFSSKSLGIGPVRRPCIPAHPSRSRSLGRERQRLVTRREPRIPPAKDFTHLIGKHFCRQGGPGRLLTSILPGESVEISRSPFQQLHLDSIRPASGKHAVPAESVHEHPVVPRLVRPVAPGVLSPLVFQHQVVIAIGLPGAQVSPSLSGDPQPPSLLEDERFLGRGGQRSLRVQMNHEIVQGTIRQQVDHRIRHHGFRRWRWGFLPERKAPRDQREKHYGPPLPTLVPSKSSGGNHSESYREPYFPESTQLR